MSEQSLEKLVKEQQFELRNVQFLFDIAYLSSIFLDFSKKTVELQHTLKDALELFLERSDSPFLALNLALEYLQVCLRESVPRENGVEYVQERL